MVPSWSEIDTAYIAGIIDGEGCITLTSRVRNKNMNYNGVITVTNTNKILIEWIVRMFGGSRIHEYIHAPWKPYYIATCNNLKDIEEILGRIIPFLRVKRLQAELLKEYCIWRLSHEFRFNSEDHVFVEPIMNKIHDLNKKGGS